MDAYAEANRKFTLDGCIVLTVGAVTTGDAEDQRTKAKLDVLHLRKIDLADYIYVLNVDQYIGESTAREMAYARSTGKPIRFLEPPKMKPVTIDLEALRQS